MTDDRSAFTEAREDLKTPAEWCRIEGVEILDPDGWRGRDGRPWTDPITLAEFQERLVTCTMRHVVKGGDGREEMQAARDAGLKQRHETREARAIRRQVAEEIAAEIIDRPGPDPSPASPAWWAGYEEARADMAKVAREIGSKETS